jgi:hypothetical protein
MAAAGFSVQPEVLENYSTALDARAQRVVKAGDRIAALNGFDVNAFGILVGQALAVPTRFALLGLKDTLHAAADSTNSAAEKVRTAAKTYRETDGAHSKVIEGLHP